MYASISNSRPSSPASTQPSTKSVELNIKELNEFWLSLYEEDAQVSEADIEKLEKFEFQLEARWPLDKRTDAYKQDNFLEAMGMMQMLRIRIANQFLDSSNIDRFIPILEKSSLFFEKFRIEFDSNNIIIREIFSFVDEVKNIFIPKKIEKSILPFNQDAILFFNKSVELFFNKDLTKAENFTNKSCNAIKDIVFSMKDIKNKNYIMHYFSIIFGEIFLIKGNFKKAQENLMNNFIYFDSINLSIFIKYGLMDINYYFYKNKASEKLDPYIEKIIEKYLDFPQLPPFIKDYCQINSSSFHTTAWPSGEIEINNLRLNIAPTHPATSVNEIINTDHLVLSLQRAEDNKLQQDLFKFALSIKQDFFNISKITLLNTQEIVALAAIADPSFYRDLISETLRRINNKSSENEYFYLTQGLLAMLNARAPVLLNHPELERNIFSDSKFNYLPLRIQQSKMSIKVLKEKLIDITKENVKLSRFLPDIEKDFGTAKPLNETLSNLWMEIKKLEKDKVKDLLEGMHASAQLKILMDFISLESDSFKKFLIDLNGRLVQAVENNQLENVKILLHIISQFLDIAITLPPIKKPIENEATKKIFGEMRFYLFCFTQHNDSELKYLALYALEALQYILPEESRPFLTNEQWAKIGLFALQIAVLTAAHTHNNNSVKPSSSDRIQTGRTVNGRGLAKDLGSNLISPVDILQSNNKENLPEFKHNYHAWYPALWVVRALLEKRDYVKLRVFLQENNQREEVAFLWGIYGYFKQMIDMPENLGYKEDREIAIAYLKKLARGGQPEIQVAARNALQAAGIGYGPKPEQPSVDDALLVLPPYFWKGEPNSNELLEKARQMSASQ